MAMGIIERVTALSAMGTDWLGSRQLLLLFFLGIIFIAIYAQNVKNGRGVSVNAPFIGFRSALEPKWLVGLRFTRGSRAMLREGHRRVSYGS